MKFGCFPQKLENQSRRTRFTTLLQWPSISPRLCWGRFFEIKVRQLQLGLQIRQKLFFCIPESIINIFFSEFSANCRLWYISNTRHWLRCVSRLVLCMQVKAGIQKFETSLATLVWISTSPTLSGQTRPPYGTWVLTPPASQAVISSGSRKIWQGLSKLRDWGESISLSLTLPGGMLTQAVELILEWGQWSTDQLALNVWGMERALPLWKSFTRL